MMLSLIFIWRLLLGSMLLVPINVYAGIFGPANFAECVLSRMPGVPNDTVAYEIAGQCSRVFPANVPVEKQTGLLAAFHSGSECTLKKAKNTGSALASAIIQAQCYQLYEPVPFDWSTAVPVEPEPEPRGNSGAPGSKRP